MLASGNSLEFKYPFTCTYNKKDHHHHEKKNLHNYFCFYKSNFLHKTSILTPQVTLTANLVRANQTSLELELEKSDSPPIVVPVMYNAMVPEITPAPDIKQRACFLDFCYYSEIIISSNAFRGYFTLEEPQVNEKSDDVFFKIGIFVLNVNYIIIYVLFAPTVYLSLKKFLFYHN